MYFIFLGIIILLVQLPLDWTAGHLLKTAGFALCVMGLADMRLLCRSQDRSYNDTPPVRVSGLGGIAVWKTVKKCLADTVPEAKSVNPARLGAAEMLGRNAAAGAVTALVCAGVTAVFEFFVKDRSAAANITAVLTGTAVTLLALRLVYGIIAFLDANEGALSQSSGIHRKLLFTDNRTDILRMKSLFEKTAVCIMVNLVCDIINRLVSTENIQTYSGFLGAISKITAYVLVIATAVRANSVRQGMVRKNGEFLGDTEKK